MTISYVLADADDGTSLTGLHENLPGGVSPADNELGWTISINKLAKLVESRYPTRHPPSSSADQRPDKDASESRP